MPDSEQPLELEVAPVALTDIRIYNGPLKAEGIDFAISYFGSYQPMRLRFGNELLICGRGFPTLVFRAEYGDIGPEVHVSFSYAHQRSINIPEHGSMTLFPQLKTTANSQYRIQCVTYDPRDPMGEADRNVLNDLDQALATWGSV